MIYLMSIESYATPGITGDVISANGVDFIVASGSGLTRQSWCHSVFIETDLCSAIIYKSLIEYEFSNEPETISPNNEWH